MGNVRKLQREALERAIKEAAVYGCLVHVDGDRPVDGRGHLRLIIADPKSGDHTVHTVGSSPKSPHAMVNGVGNAVRRKARALVGLGPG